MIYSMTGFGTGEASGRTKRYIVEMKSVNHRFCEIFVRTPRDFGFIDEKIKGLIRERISRGKIDVIVKQDDIIDENSSDEITGIKINRHLAKKYYDEIENLSLDLGLINDINAVELIKMPDVIIVDKKEEDTEEIFKIVKSAVDEAVDKMIAFRLIEGSKLEKDLLSKIALIEKELEDIKEYSSQIPINYMNALNDRISEYLKVDEIDEQRIAMEVAIYADKCCVDEEMVRLKSHLEHFSEEVKKGDRVGRKLDFITQEINREVNTIGSKANDQNMTKIVVEMKSILEQIREQVQNIE